MRTILEKLKRTIRDPGVLFSLLHITAFGATAGVASPVFGLAAASLALSFGFSAIKSKLIPNNLTMQNGTPLFTNGTVLGVIAAVSAASGNLPSTIISSLFAASNMTKGAEMNKWVSLKAIGQKLLPGDDIVSRTVKNTVFSAEFIASAGAFSVAFFGIGPIASLGMGAATATLVTLGSSDNNLLQPLWRKIPGLSRAYETISATKDFVQENVFRQEPKPKSDIPVSDLAMSRYVMAAISSSYAFASAVKAVSGAANNDMNDVAEGLALAFGHVCAAQGNSTIGDFQRDVLDRAKHSAPRSRCVGLRTHRPDRG